MSGAEFMLLLSLFGVIISVDSLGDHPEKRGPRLVLLLVITVCLASIVTNTIEIAKVVK